MVSSASSKLARGAILAVSGVSVGLGLGLLVAGASGLVMYTFVNRFLVVNMIDSNYFTKKSLFGVNEKTLPDVEKGESYQEDVSKYPNFAKLLNSKTPLYIVLVVAVVFVVADIILASGNSLKILAIDVVVILLTTLYSWIGYRMVSPLIFASVGLCSTLVALALENEGYRSGISLVSTIVGLVVGMALIELLSKNYKKFSKEKLNDEKINNMINTVMYETVMACIVPLGTAVICVIVSRESLLSLVMVFLAALITVSSFVTYIKRNAGKKPKKGKKKSNKQELKERTIYGLNEVK